MQKLLALRRWRISEQVRKLDEQQRCNFKNSMADEILLGIVRGIVG